MDSSQDLNKCEKCKKIYSNRSTYLKHSKTCDKQKDLKYHPCDYCPYKTSLKGNLVQHMQASHLPPDPNRNKCSKCNRNYAYPSALIRHSRICGIKDFAILSNLNRYSCAHCDYKAREKGSLSDHIQRKHFPTSNKCNKCEKIYPTSKYLRRHSKFCGISEDTKQLVMHFTCHHCDYKTHTKGRLLDHILRHHFSHKKSFEYLNRFTCDFCQKRTYAKIILLDHIHFKHLPPDPDYNKCDGCGKNYSCHKTLLSHSKLCGKSKEYIRSLLRHSCNLCDFRTSSSSHLNLHHQRKHALHYSKKIIEKSTETSYRGYLSSKELKTLCKTKRFSSRLEEKPLIERLRGIDRFK